MALGQTVPILVATLPFPLCQAQMNHSVSKHIQSSALVLNRREMENRTLMQFIATSFAWAAMHMERIAGICK